MLEENEKTDPVIRKPAGLYSKGEFVVKNARRAEQLERHDRQAKACYEAIEHEISRLRILIERLRNGEHLTECR